MYPLSTLEIYVKNLSTLSEVEKFIVIYIKNTTSVSIIDYSSFIDIIIRSLAIIINFFCIG